MEDRLSNIVFESTLHHEEAREREGGASRKLRQVQREQSGERVRIPIVRDRIENLVKAFHWLYLRCWLLPHLYIGDS